MTTDTERLNRLLKLDDEITVNVNRYGNGAAGNSWVSITNRHDIDCVLKAEAVALRAGEGK